MHRDGPGGPPCDERAPGAVVEKVAESDVEKQGDGPCLPKRELLGGGCTLPRQKLLLLEVQDCLCQEVPKAAMGKCIISPTSHAWLTGGYLCCIRGSCCAAAWAELAGSFAWEYKSVCSSGAFVAAAWQICTGCSSCRHLCAHESNVYLMHTGTCSSPTAAYV
eukprot:1156476-Pelagomonas_calceolata.AAC.8